MKPFKFARLFMAILTNFVLALFISVPIAAFAKVDPFVLASGITTASTAFHTANHYFKFFNLSGSLFMALQPEIWIGDIQEKLFDGNAFINASMDHSQYVENKTVHVPQAGSAPTVEKNRAVFPATIAERTDTELTYDLAEYTTDPILIRDLDEIQTSYDKRNSVSGAHFAAIGDRIASELLYAWSLAGATRVLRTTGAATATLPNTTATGTRLRATKEDLAKIAANMDRDKVPTAGRHILLPTEMLQDIFSISELMSFDYMKGASSMPDGALTKIFGLTVWNRSTVQNYTNAGTAVRKTVNQAAAATDCAGAIAWSEYSVGRALGNIKIFVEEDSAAYYGTVMSAMVLFGASRLRSDDAGVWNLAQGYVAP